ncbi:MAG: fibronectin type III domain-containing protein [Muribaculaceae bacterium]|nr:fibronectin type III domain-containing protein [Muribaculaceae bacterium]
MKRILLIGALLLSMAGLKAQQRTYTDEEINKMSIEEYAEYLNNIPIDTAKYDSISNRHKFVVQTLARPKGDKVILRWAPDQYVPWFFSNTYGYRVLRLDEDGNLDTLAACLKPMPLEQMKTHFEATDSLAGAAAQMIYGKGTTLKDALTTDGAKGIMKVFEEQETRFAYAMLMSEIRPDLAEAMALRFEDKTAKKGKEYTYIVASNIPDTIAYMSTMPITVKNEREDPVHFDPVITDSIGDDGRSIRLFWPMNTYFSTYDIECRYNGGEWKKLNDRPFITLMTFTDESAGVNIYGHNDIEVGVYEYRICGYDAFGDKSNYSKTIKVELKDILAPTPPILRKFYLNKDENGDYVVDILWTKADFEPDFVGYDIYYYHPKVHDNWMKINEQRLAPTDTLYRYKLPIDMSAHIAIAAVDTIGNYTTSLPAEVHIADETAPSAPTNLKYKVSPNGMVIITWSPSPEDDVYQYQLYAANNPKKDFLPMKGKTVSDTLIVDTISGTNQFSYYRLKAFDYSGNESKFSEILTVQRLNFKQPQPCRIDSLSFTEEYVYMKWFPSPESDIKQYYVYRHLAGQEVSDLIKIIPADSLKGNRIEIYDYPTPNQEKRYYYYIESMNTTGVSSNPSHKASVLFKGPRMINAKISLNAVYRPESERIVLAWDIRDLTQEDINDGAYICLYRKIEGEEYFRFMETLKINERSTYDRRVPEGKSAEYEMRIITRSGKRSEYSNRTKATVPVKQEEMSN